MSLSITQRVTITQAVLTLCVLVPAGVAVYTLTIDGLRTERRKAAKAAARTASRELLGHLEKDTLVDYDEPTNMPRVELASRDWALVRGDGRVVRAAGCFDRLAPEDVAGTLHTRSLTSDGREFFIESTPLPKRRTPGFMDLPATVRRAAREACPTGTFLMAKSENEHGITTIEIEFLEADHTYEVEMLLDGQIVDEEVEPLPYQLPDDLDLAAMGWTLASEEIEWAVHDYQLIATVDVLRDGRPEPLSINRYGEVFSRHQGTFSGPDEESRIQLLVAIDASNIAATARSLLAILLVGGPVLWLLMVSIGWFVVRRALSPVNRILETANRIEPPHFEERLPLGEVRDELSSIAETVNRMLDRIEEGFVREKRFTGDASHELRGPLAKVIADIDVALSCDREPDEYRHALLRCRRYAESLQRVVDSLLLLARLDRDHPSLSLETIDMGNLVVDTVRTFRQEDADRIEVDLGDDSAPLMVRGDPRLMGILLHNLVENALRYSATDDAVRVAVRRCGTDLTVEVEDGGEGIPDEYRELVFGRFFRLDPSRARASGGIGLGLSIVRSIARAHKGRIDLRPGAAGGTVASFCVPCVESGPKPVAV